MAGTRYEKAIQRLYELQKFGIKLGLNSTANLLGRLGNPHHGLACLHIAGTNGKGSVGAYCEAALTSAGVKTGMYLSPHLVDFCERFRVAGREISRHKVMALADAVWSVTDPAEPPTFFEFVTAMAFLHFAQEGVALAVMETGMGGRLDATNVCEPVATVITNIGLEHQDYLGNTLAAIAFEKAGVIKPGVPLIHGVNQAPARRVVEARAAELGAPVIQKGRDIRFRRSADGAFSLWGRLWNFSGLTSALAGRHQPANACLALGALEALSQAGFQVGPGDFSAALGRVRWPGRLENIPRPAGRPALWLDGAHNLPAVKALAESLGQILKGRSPVVMVMGIMADKALGPMVRALSAQADRVIFSRPAYERAAAPEQLAAQAPKGLSGQIVTPLARAVRRAEELAGPGGAVLVTGSLFTVGEVKALLRNGVL